MKSKPTATALRAILSLAVILSISPVPADDAASINLLGDSLDQWNLDKPGAWELKDGVLGTSEKPGGYIWTEETYADFELSLEYKTSKDCNSGVFFRTDPKNAVQGGFEIQIASAGKYDGKHVVGSLYDAKVPSEAAGKPDGEWNTMTLTVNGPFVKIVLNGKEILEANLDDWTTANLNPDGSKNKFKTALKDLPRTGHIGFQYHGQPVWYRNVSLKKTLARISHANSSRDAARPVLTRRTQVFPQGCVNTLPKGKSSATQSARAAASRS